MGIGVLTLMVHLKGVSTQKARLRDAWMDVLTLKARLKDAWMDALTQKARLTDA